MSAAPRLNLGGTGEGLGDLHNLRVGYLPINEIMLSLPSAQTGDEAKPGISHTVRRTDCGYK